MGLIYGKIFNKHARYNVCLGDESQEPEYEKGRGRVVPWKEVSVLGLARKKLGSWWLDRRVRLWLRGTTTTTAVGVECGSMGRGEEECDRTAAVERRVPASAFPVVQEEAADRLASHLAAG